MPGNFRLAGTIGGHAVLNPVLEPAAVLSWRPSVCRRCDEFFTLQQLAQQRESVLDTARTYVAMGADVLVVRRSTGVPQLALDLQEMGERTVVLNEGDGLHSHPSQGLLDLLTLARYFLLSTQCQKRCKGAAS